MRPFACALCLGCAAGAPLWSCYEKEAMDPHEILAEDLQGVPAADDGAGAPAPLRQPNSADKPREKDVPASRADCERAVRHMIVLGQRLELQGEADASKQKELEARHRAELASDAVQQRIQTLTADCLKEGKTRRETRCIEQVQREADIDRCVE